MKYSRTRVVLVAVVGVGLLGSLGALAFGEGTILSGEVTTEEVPVELVDVALQGGCEDATLAKTCVSLESLPQQVQQRIQQATAEYGETLRRSQFTVSEDAVRVRYNETNQGIFVDTGATDVLSVVQKSQRNAVGQVAAAAVTLVTREDPDGTQPIPQKAPPSDETTEAAADDGDYALPVIRDVSDQPGGWQRHVGDILVYDDPHIRSQVTTGWYKYKLDPNRDGEPGVAEENAQQKDFWTYVRVGNAVPQSVAGGRKPAVKTLSVQSRPSDQHDNIYASLLHRSPAGSTSSRWGQKTVNLRTGLLGDDLSAAVTLDQATMRSLSSSAVDFQEKMTLGAEVANTNTIFSGGAQHVAALQTFAVEEGKEPLFADRTVVKTTMTPLTFGSSTAWEHPGWDS